MICQVCREAADAIAAGSTRKRHLTHRGCKGCTCQHRVGQAVSK